jgi:hypothetical protein
MFGKDFRNLFSRKEVIALAMAFLVVTLLLPSTVGIAPTAIAQSQQNQQNSTGQQNTQKVVHYSGHLEPWQTITPFGVMNKTQVHKYNGTVINADAELAKLKKLPHNASSAPVGGGWNEEGQIFISPITSMTGNWIVPSSPESQYPSNSFDVTYIFLGVQNDDPNPSNQIILQPVLQYGFNGYYNGGNYWQLVSWECIASCPLGSSEAIFSTPISASPSDVIYGSIIDNNGLWAVTTTDKTSGQGTQIETSTSSIFQEADSALETNGISSCSYLPGNIFFYNVQINSANADFSPQVPNSICSTMSAQNDYPDAGIYFHTINSGGVWIMAKEQSTGFDIAGLNYNVYDPNNNPVSNGFTPLYVPISSSGTYNIHFNNYGNYYFTNSPSSSSYGVYNWGGIVSASLSSSQDQNTKGIYYNNANPGNYALIQFKSLSSSCNCDRSPYIGELDSGGHTLSQGYTPYSIGLPVGSSITVDFDNFGGYSISSATPNPSSIQQSFTVYPAWGAQQVISLSNTGGGSNYSDQGNYN